MASTTSQVGLEQRAAAWPLASPIDSISFDLTGAGLRLRLVPVGSHAVIDCLVRLRFAFYAEHMNNMFPFAFEDRLGHAATRERPDILFFDGEAPIDVWAEGSSSEARRRLIFRDSASDFEAELHVRVDGEQLRIEPVIVNTADAIQRLMVVRLELASVQINGESPRSWRTPPTYTGKMATDGLVSDIPESDLRQLLLPLGLTQPLMLLGGDEPGELRLGCSAWLNTYGSFIATSAGDFAVHTFVNRKLVPRQRHELGPVLVRSADDWRQTFSQFAQQIPPQFGFASPRVPEWVWQLRNLSFPPRLFPIGDPRWRAYLQWGKDHGFNATIGWGWIWRRHNDRLCAISPDADGLPLDHENGATEEAVRQHLQMHRDLEMRCFLWSPTTGASPYSPATKSSPQWFCRDVEGRIQGSWNDPDGTPWLIDSNPLNEDYHRYWRGVTLYAAELGFDGVFFDGVLARPCGEFHGTFPGEVQDGMIRALRRLRAELDERGLEDFVVKPEGGDVSLAPGSYWMNEAKLQLRHPEPPSRRAAEWRDVEMAFLHADYPRRSIQRFAEQFESMARSWPPGMPGNACPAGMCGPDAPMAVRLAYLRLIALGRNIWHLPMINARQDPDASLPPQDPASLMAEDHERPADPKPDPAFREYRDNIRELNAFRAAHPWVASASVDFDLVRSDRGGCPAFVRVAPTGERLLAVVNLSEETCAVRLELAAEVRRAIRVAEPLVLPGFSLDLASLAAGKCRLAPGQAIAALWRERRDGPVIADAGGCLEEADVREPAGGGV